MRSRIYEIPLHFPELIEGANGEYPSVTVYADRSVEVFPERWGSSPPTRKSAAKVLRVARKMGYEIQRRYL